MASYEQTVSLLRQNKRAQAEAVAFLGFSDVNATTRASLFPMLVRWAHGLLDITIAARCKSAGGKFGQHVYFTLAEWQALSELQRGEYVLRGIRLRAMARTLIIALTQESLKWGTATAVSGATSMGCPAFYHFLDGRKETQTIMTHNTGREDSNCTGSPAAEYALTYQAFGQVVAGFEDDTEWAIPTMADLIIMYRYRNEINAMMTAIGSDKLTTASYWSCCQYDATQAYRLPMSNGQYGWSNKATAACVVRLIASE